MSSYSLGAATNGTEELEAVVSNSPNPLDFVFNLDGSGNTGAFFEIDFDRPNITPPGTETGILLLTIISAETPIILGDGSFVIELTVSVDDASGVYDANQQANVYIGGRMSDGSIEMSINGIKIGSTDVPEAGSMAVLAGALGTLIVVRRRTR